MLDDKTTIDRCRPDHPGLWCNRLLGSAGYQEIHNRSSAGANNETIFQIAIENMLSQRYDLVVVQWTLIDRLNVNVGLELFSTRSLLENNMDISVNPYQTISGRWLNDLGDRLRFLLNPHWQILKLVQYVNILKRLQESQGGKIAFVNGVMYLPNDYFLKMPYQSPRELPLFVQKMLKVETRDDSEIADLYGMIHDQYQQNQGIQPALWMNLYQPLLPMKVDNIENDDPHPGWLSQDVFYDFLQQKKDLL